jgi:hypothetical protein
MKLGYWVEGNWEPLAVLGTALPRVSTPVRLGPDGIDRRAKAQNDSKKNMNVA